jgi:hypothetical protein
MYSYTELESKFNRSTNSNKTIYKLENNTYVEKDNNQYSIILHGSYIAKITQDTIILNAGNYFTHTTKDRLNKILSDNQVPYRIYQDHFTWFLWGLYNLPNDRTDFKDKIPFYNGITFIYELNRLNGNGWKIDGYD